MGPFNNLDHRVGFEPTFAMFRAWSPAVRRSVNKSAGCLSVLVFDTESLPATLIATHSSHLSDRERRRLKGGSGSSSAPINTSLKDRFNNESDCAPPDGRPTHSLTIDC